ncbi:MAG: GNAT family N-acetyltransferase [Flavobacteriaceae bacterium]|nr:GNAT family N-acetyltransferase [Flavobacteriaceae bacterium]
MIEISRDKNKLDIAMIHAFLTETYWAKGRTREEVERSIQHCLCYGVYLDNRQIGFARILTDYTIFAYLMDVFILQEHQGKGYGKELMKVIINDEDLRTCKWMLKTGDAHRLYEQFGFESAPNPERVMERNPAK